MIYSMSAAIATDAAELGANPMHADIQRVRHPLPPVLRFSPPCGDRTITGARAGVLNPAT